MHRKVIYEDENVTWYYMGRDPSKPDSIIDTNEYLIVSNNEAILLDPGGTEIFPSVLTSVSEVVDLSAIKSYLCSHQDPDIMSSLPLWMALTPNAQIYLSWLWGGFVSHFGQEYSKCMVSLPDEGGEITLGGRNFIFFPAHHCHSPGNFNFYDPKSKILFCGDIGSALIPPEAPIFVEDFEAHTKYMTKFHKRWMSSNQAKNDWVKRVRKLDVEMLCPQHGSIFGKENVKKFLDWFEELEVGTDFKAA